MKPDLYLPRVSVVFPYPRRLSAGGPTGVISHNLVTYQGSGLEVTPEDSELRLTRELRWQARAAVLRRHGPQHWPRLLRGRAQQNHCLFRASGAHRSRILWFMDASVYAEFAEFISPNQRVVFQPQCPELPWEELAGTGVSDPAALENCRQQTRAVFARADDLVFPHPEAVPIYQSLARDRHRIHYLPNAIQDPPSAKPIPLDPALTFFLFIGRRLPIKGYDIAREAFLRARQESPHIRLVVCGGGPRETHPAIIDVGPTERVNDWIAGCDCVINTNRQSYMDLSVLETLAAGVPIALTDTHGHAIFRQHASPALCCLGRADADAFAGFMLRFRKDDPAVRQGREQNRALFLEHYCTARYHQNLSALLGRWLGLDDPGATL